VLCGLRPAVCAMVLPLGGHGRERHSQGISVIARSKAVACHEDAVKVAAVHDVDGAKLAKVSGVVFPMIFVPRVRSMAPQLSLPRVFACGCVGGRSCRFSCGGAGPASQPRREQRELGQVTVSSQGSLRGNNGAGAPIAWPCFKPPQCTPVNWSGAPVKPSCSLIRQLVVGRNGQSNTAMMRQVSTRL